MRAAKTANGKEEAQPPLSVTVFLLSVGDLDPTLVGKPSYPGGWATWFQPLMSAIFEVSWTSKG